MQHLSMPAQAAATFGPAALGAAAGRCLAAERARWALWLPVVFGIGIAVYFSLPLEPALWAGAAVAVPAAGAALFLVRGEALRIALWLVVVAACGFSATQLRTVLVAAPVIEKRLGPAWIEGRVREVQERTDDRRIVLDTLKIPRLATGQTPERVRFTLRGEAPALAPGDRIRVRVVLYPPPTPAAPGAFDFARKAYFERLGGVGYAISGAEIVGRAVEGEFALWIARLRQALTSRIRDAVPGAEGGIAAALMTGDRNGVPEPVNEAMRDSGLAHLLSISGLHMTMVGGLLFFVVRLGLVLHERTALRMPIKKIAALCAIAGATAYLLISGGTEPTVRSFLMLALVMLAICLDRLPISMNMVAWAAAAILLTTPESLTNVSFQMSFAAVIALVAVYERHGDRLHAGQGMMADMPRAIRYVAGVLLTTLVAGLATAPFGLFHFNRMAVYGMLANLVAIPLTGFWIMPLAVVAFALMPFGLEWLALAPMGWGISALIVTAETTQALPGAAILVRAMPTAGFLLIVAGGLWLCLWCSRWRIFGLVPIIVGLMTMGVARPPDVLIDEAAKLVGVRAPDGGFALSGRADSFTAETWLRRVGAEEALPWPRSAVAGVPWLRCDAVGCIHRAHGRRIALVSHVSALAEDCARADIVISRVPVRGRCRGPAVVIDRFAVWREGAHALWLDDDEVRVESVRDRRGARPWHPNWQGW